MGQYIKEVNVNLILLRHISHTAGISRYDLKNVILRGLEWYNYITVLFLNRLNCILFLSNLT